MHIRTFIYLKADMYISHIYMCTYKYIIFKFTFTTMQNQNATVTHRYIFLLPEFQ